jgi:hypothetical protein
MWVLMSDEMNFGGRFQYPTYAIVILSWFPLVKDLHIDLRLPSFKSLGFRQRLAIALAGACIFTSVFGRVFIADRNLSYGRDERLEVGAMLSRYKAKNYTVATTEAGLIPLYSDWRAIDTWGLNDSWIAHHGGITEMYLEQQKPDVILFNKPSGINIDPRSDNWVRQTNTLQAYAEGNGFTLAITCTVSPNNNHYYYVRASIADHDEIVDRLQKIFHPDQGDSPCMGRAPPQNPSHGSGWSVRSPLPADQ